MEFRIQDYYDLHGGKSFKINLHPGLNVLIGPNGAGKTTALRQIKEKLKEDKIEYVMYDNISDGHSHAYDKYLHTARYDMIAATFCASEAEAIIGNLGDPINKFGSLVRKYAHADEEVPIFLLLDGIDSGMDVKNAADIADTLSNFLPEQCKNTSVIPYIVMTCNNYEFVRQQPFCISVKSGVEKVFKDYEDFRKFILNYNKKKGKKTDGEE